MKIFTQGVVGWVLSVDFRKNDIRLIFHIFDALRTKKSISQVVFLPITLTELGGIILVATEGNMDK